MSLKSSQTSHSEAKKISEDALIITFMFGYNCCVLKIKGY